MRLRTIGVPLGALAIAAAPLVAGAPAGASGHAPRLTASIFAHPRVVLANGKSTSRIFVQLRHGFRADAKATVTLATTDTPSGGGSCGTLAASTGTTRRDGVFSTVYTSSSVVGFCTITATSGTATASVTIDQADATLAAAHTHYRIRGAAAPGRIAANGTSTSTLTFTVTNGTTPVTGDAIYVASFSLQRHACGTIALASGTTNSSGQVTATYTSSTSRGLCVIVAAEASTARLSNPVLIRQTS